MSKPVVGVIEGGGTGPELADVYRKTLSAIYLQKKKKEVEYFSFVEEFGYNPNSFWGLRDAYYNKPYREVKKLIDAEVKDILKYDNKLLKKNPVGIFRTAINAETLYYLRAQAKTLKVVPITVEKDGKKFNLLFIRDQVQGFYTNKEIKMKNNGVEIKVEYTNKNFELMLTFLKKITKKLDFKDYEIEFMYKYHIVGIELQKMIDKAIKVTKTTVPYRIDQPDSGLHLIFDDMFKKGKKIKKNIVIICGNEIGDMLLEAIIHYFHLGTKESVYTANYVLGKDNIEALQTMHGSADDIAGQGTINPIATLKAVAHSLEFWLKVKGSVKQMDKLLEKAIKKGIVTRDQGGKSDTDDLTDYVIKNWK